ncbi:MAG: tagaturonate reductase [Ruminococcaceae bacterium]|nr:tagaturonate reductase [Oscillospiraceae bacterium]
MGETIIQFGQGNFLRGFADDFIDILNTQGLYDGKAVIVKPTPRGNLDTFNAQGCVYNLVVRGIENGTRVSRRREIHSVSRCVNPYDDFDAYLALAENPAMRFIISNTTEAGIAFDGDCKFTDRPALSYPGKLTQLLFARYKAGLGGFVLLPCELIDNNGDALRKCVLKYAELWKLGAEFIRWVKEENTFCNTLVDRIVTGFPESEAEEICREIGYTDKLLDTAEPYHLWAIEGDFENELPLKKAGVNAVWTNDIKPLKKRKVRLLNGAHTSMVFPALLCGIETVGECLKDEDIRAFLHHFLFDCALSVLGDNEDNRAFAEAVLQRFENPFIAHKLTAIALNSVSKFGVRVVPTALDCKERNGAFPKAAAFSLAALIAYYKQHSPNDSDTAAAELIKTADIDTIVRSDIFGADLSAMCDDVRTAYEMIENGNIREGIRWAIS